MKQYRRTQWRIITLIVVYTAVSLGAKQLTGDELFPFFNWSLFTKVPNEKHDFGLLITAVNGKPVEPPLYFEEAEDWITDPSSIVAYNAIQDFGRAVRAEDAEMVEEIRPFVESLYLEDQPMQYSIVRRTYLPLQRWQTGNFEKETLLEQFVVGENLP